MTSITVTGTHWHGTIVRALAALAGETVAWTREEEQVNAAGEPTCTATIHGHTAQGKAAVDYLLANVSSAGHLGGGAEASAVNKYVEQAFQVLLAPKVYNLFKAHGQTLYSLVGMGVRSSAFQASVRAKVAAEVDAVSLAKQLNEVLLTSTFLVGEHITAADVATAAGFAPHMALLWTPADRAAIPNFTRWYRTVYAQTLFSQEFPRMVDFREGGQIDAKPVPAVVSALADESVARNAQHKKKGETQRTAEKAVKKVTGSAAIPRRDGAGAAAGEAGAAGATGEKPTDLPTSQPASNKTDITLSKDEKIAKLMPVLESLNISVTTIHHAPAFTVEESVAATAPLGGLACKNLFVKAKKGRDADDSMMWLIVAAHDSDTDLKKVAKLLGYGNIVIRFADEELLHEHLGVAKGSVSPFALLNDKMLKINFAADRRVLQADKVNIHPLTNEASCSVATADLLRFIQHTRHTVTPLDL